MFVWVGLPLCLTLLGGCASAGIPVSAEEAYTQTSTAQPPGSAEEAYTQTSTAQPSVSGEQVTVATTTVPFPVRSNHHYVNTSDGSDASAGNSPTTAWRSLDYALHMLEAGDTLTIDAPPTMPARDILTTVADGTADAPITIEGPSPDNRAYVVVSKDISQNAPIGNLIPHGNFEG
jgi:hypothetical protein